MDDHYKPLSWFLDTDTGEQYRYEGATYEVVQAHTTQADWTPPTVPALFTPMA